MFPPRATWNAFDLNAMRQVSRVAIFRLGRMKSRSWNLEEDEEAGRRWLMMLVYR
jgi:hypothetical protein